MTLELTKPGAPVIRSPDWLYPTWSIHRRFKIGSYEVYIGIHNSWRWESWSNNGSIHLMVEGYDSEERALAASPCSKHRRLAYEELCRISFNPAYAWLIIHTGLGQTWGRSGFATMTDAEINVRAWLKSGRPELQGEGQ